MSTHPIMETTSYSLSFNPNLPFTCFTIPWWADMMPFLHSERIIQSVKGEKNILLKKMFIHILLLFEELTCIKSVHVKPLKWNWIPLRLQSKVEFHVVHHQLEIFKMHFFFISLYFIYIFNYVDYLIFFFVIFISTTFST